MAGQFKQHAAVYERVLLQLKMNIHRRGWRKDREAARQPKKMNRLK